MIFSGIDIYIDTIYYRIWCGYAICIQRWFGFLSRFTSHFIIFPVSDMRTFPVSLDTAIQPVSLFQILIKNKIVTHRIPRNIDE